MSDEAVDAAVEKILSDQSYAQHVYMNPEEALASQFNLEPGEWQSLAWGLRRDVEDSLGDTQGFTVEPPAIDFSLVQFTHISRVPAVKGEWDRKAMGPTVWD